MMAYRDLHERDGAERVEHQPDLAQPGRGARGGGIRPRRRLRPLLGGLPFPVGRPSLARAGVRRRRHQSQSVTVARGRFISFATSGRSSRRRLIGLFIGVLVSSRRRSRRCRCRRRRFVTFVGRSQPANVRLAAGAPPPPPATFASPARAPPAPPPAAAPSPAAAAGGGLCGQFHAAA